MLVVKEGRPRAAVPSGLFVNVRSEVIEMRVNVKAFALSCGLLWGIGLFLLTWWFIVWDGATGEATLIGQMYRGYNISPLGSVIGLVWGLADGAFGGLVLALVYNRLAGREAR